jgi:hypothetical protein
LVFAKITGSLIGGVPRGPVKARPLPFVITLALAKTARLNFRLSKTLFFARLCLPNPGKQGALPQKDL